MCAFSSDQGEFSFHLLADVLGVADRDRRFDDDRRLVLLGSVLGGFQDEFDDGLHCGAVKEVLLRVVVGRRRDNDEVRVSVCGRSVGRCLEIELTRSVLGFSQEFLDVLVLDGGLVVIELLDLLRNDVNSGDFVVLGEEDSQ